MGYILPGGGGGGVPEYPYISINADLPNPVANTQYLIDSSGGPVVITLPLVTAGNEQWYQFTLDQNSNHAKIQTSEVSLGVFQQIANLDSISLSTEHARVTIKANGLDGYVLLDDTREYYREISVVGNITFATGYESGALYTGNLLDATDVIITVADPIVEHLGDWAKFIKFSGVNSSMRIKTASGSFDQTIFENNKGFELGVIKDGAGDPQYVVSQDSRPSPSNLSINFLPTDTISVLEPTYSVLETDSQPEEDIVSAAISSIDPLNPNSLGFWINDNKALIGTLSDRNINAIAQVALNVAANRSVKIKFKYYEYDYTTMLLNPIPLSETSYSAPISLTTIEQRFVGGVLPSNTWATESGETKTLVVELLAYKSGGGGDNPVLKFRSGGNNPSKTTIDVPVSAVNHNSMGGVVDAQTNVPDGHVNNSFPLQLPELTTIERDAISVGLLNDGMIMYNKTENVIDKYSNSAWVGLNVAYATPWINRSLWQNKNPGSNQTKNTDSNVTHGLGLHLSDLNVSIVVSPDGTDLNSFLLGTYVNTDAAGDRYGVGVDEVDSDNIIIRTGIRGILYINNTGNSTLLDTEDWFYKIVVSPK